MKKFVIFFGLIGFLLGVLFPIMEQYISFEETAGYCNDCFRPFWKNISNTGWWTIFIYGIGGISTGGTVGFIIYKMTKKTL